MAPSSDLTGDPVADVPASLEIIGAPFDRCGFAAGSRLGPAALRLAGLAEGISALGFAVREAGDVAVGDGDPFAALLNVLAGLRERVGAAIARGSMPLVLGGEHTLAAASVAAGMAADPEMALVWIDAHADVNTPGSSLTGNLHGMPIAALAALSAGIGEDSEWRRLVLTLDAPPLPLDRVAWFGLRDVDAAERPRLAGLPITMHDVDRHGVEACVRRLGEWLGEIGAPSLWISFDVDVLDPFLAPGTGTAVRGGLSYREAHLLAELLCETLDERGVRLAGVDLMETNPISDAGNATAAVAVEWIASLLGKRILGERRPPLLRSPGAKS